MKSPINSKRKYILIGCLVVACGILVYFILDKKQSDPGASSTSSAIRFTLTDIEKNDESGFNVTVRIAEKISEVELKSLAQRVKKFVKATAETGIVYITIPGMELSKGAWATVEFIPEMQVRILEQPVGD